MADLGAIGYGLSIPGPQYVKAVTGKVTENNAPAALRRARLYNRINGALIDTGLSSPQGDYNLNAPASLIDPCFVVVFDDEVAPLRNAIIRDRVVPT